jgi:hypothetical protein
MITEFTVQKTHVNPSHALETRENTVLGDVFASRENTVLDGLLEIGVL